MGRFILFRETECAATGTNDCRIVGKPVEDWPDADQYLPTPGGLHGGPPARAARAGRDAALHDLRAQVRPRPDRRLGGIPNGLRPHQQGGATNVTVLLLGQTGVGKERFARTLHELSPRAKAPSSRSTVPPCPTTSSNPELFGVEKGLHRRPRLAHGKFERADGGTLFLDEVGELPLAAQAKPLRVLQEGKSNASATNVCARSMFAW